METHESTAQTDVQRIEKLASDLHSNLDEPTFFGKLSQHIKALFPIETVEIYQSFQDGAIQLVAKNGEPVISGEVNEKPIGVVGHVCRTKRAYYSNAVKRDPLFSQDMTNLQADAVLCVPINSQGTLLGAILVSVEGDQRRYSEEDIAFILKTLNAVEKPLNNMRMYLLAKHLNRELSRQIIQKEKELEDKKNQGIGASLVRRQKTIGHSSQLTKVIDVVSKVAQEEFPILLQGENGTGRKHFAKEIHLLSARSEGPCIVAHCNALAPEVLEAELFGTPQKRGLIELATEGTLILSEISDITLELQDKILRLLTTGQFYREGQESPVSVNVRIVTTSRINLHQRVQEQAFREDLYYRLSTIKLDLPSLRERQSDIKVLAEFFLNEGKPVEEHKVLSESAVQVLESHIWTRNVEELKNLMEKVFILADGRFIDATLVKENLLSDRGQYPEQLQDDFEAVPLSEIEKEHIVRTLEHLGGNKTKAAKALGITVKTLYNKLHSYGMVQKNS